MLRVLSMQCMLTLITGKLEATLVKKKNLLEQRLVGRSMLEYSLNFN